MAEMLSGINGISIAKAIRPKRSCSRHLESPPSTDSQRSQPALTVRGQTAGRRNGMPSMAASFNKLNYPALSLQHQKQAEQQKQARLRARRRVGTNKLSP